MNLSFDSLPYISPTSIEKETKRPEDFALTHRWDLLNQMVFSLLESHEPKGDVTSRLEGDLRMMRSSGLVSEHECPVAKACREAARIAADLRRCLS